MDFPCVHEKFLRVGFQTAGCLITVQKISQDTGRKMSHGHSIGEKPSDSPTVDNP